MPIYRWCQAEYRHKMKQKVKKQSGNLGCRSVGGGWRVGGGLVED